MKYSILFILFFTCECTSEMSFNLNSANQIIEKNKFIYTIESSRNGSSLKWIKKYNKKLQLVKGFEFSGYGNIDTIQNDTVFFQLYVSNSLRLPNKKMEKWIDEYIKYEEIKITGFISDKKLNVYHFIILNDELVLNTSNYGTYSVLVSNIKCNNGQFFTQRYSENELLSTIIEFNDEKLKNEFASTLIRYWQNKLK